MDGLSDADARNISDFVRDIDEKAIIGGIPEMSMETHVRLQNKIEELGFKMVEFDEGTKEEMKTLENMGFYTKLRSGTARDGIIIGLQKIASMIEESVRGDTTLTDSFWMPSNADNNKDFFGAIDKMTPYYDASLIYSTAKGLPPQVTLDLIDTLYSSYGDARGLNTKVYKDLLRRFLRPKIHDSLSNLWDDYTSLKEILNLHYKDRDKYRLNPTSMMDKMKDRTKYTHSQVV